MGIEVERKFLVEGDGWRGSETHSLAMSQGYLANDHSCSVRVRREGQEARLNIKSATLGVSRLEFEYPIPVDEADEMLARFCAGRQVVKTRYFVPCDGNTWEVDVFEGANAGLVVAEIELRSPDEAFTAPPWLGPEVSHDPRYYNVCLIDRPYSQWR